MRHLFLCAILVLGADEPEPGRKMARDVDATCKLADEAYAEAIKRAEAVLEKARKEAMAARLKAYKERLAKTTQAGDFDRASVIKADIATMELPPRSPIPKDAVKFNGHHYQVIRDPVTWHVAKRKCEQLGGHLVTLETPEEAEFLIQLLRQSKTSAWLGASDEEEEGKWVWVTGRPAIISAAVLDNANGHEHALQWSSDKEICNDLMSDSRMPFLCEWDK